MSVHLRHAALGVALFLTACDGAGDVDAGPRVDASGAEAELGTVADSEFAPLNDGDDLPYILGPQGGFHFLASVRVRGVEPGNPTMLGDPSNPRVEFRAWRGDTRVDIRASEYIQGLDPVAGDPGTFEMVGRLLILNITSCADLSGETIRVEVEVEDVNGVIVTDEVTVTAVPDPISCG